MQPKFTDLSLLLEAFPNYRLHPLLSYHTCHIRGKKGLRMNRDMEEIKGRIQSGCYYSW